MPTMLEEKQIQDIVPTIRSDNRYQFAYPYIRDNGKVGRRIIYGKSSDICISKVLKFQLELKTGVAEVKSIKEKKLDKAMDITVEGACHKWIRGYVLGSKADATAEGYLRECKNYIIPSLGNIKVTDLSIEDIGTFFNILKSRGLAFTTVDGAVTRVGQILDYIIATPPSIIMFNVVKNIIIRDKINSWKKELELKNKKLDEKGNTIGKKAKALTREEIEAFIRLVFRRRDRLAVGYLLSLCYGLRPGEVLGLKYTDISYEHKLIRLEQDLHRVSLIDAKTLEFTHTVLKDDGLKSKNSKRPVFISDEMIKILKWHKSILDDEKETYKYRYNDMGYVCATRYGTPTENRNYARSFEKVVKKEDASEILDVVPENLRASFAKKDKLAVAYMIYEKYDLEIAEVLPLKWKDINDKKIYVNKILKVDGKIIDLKDVKEIEIDDDTLTILEYTKKSKIEKNNSKHTDDDFICGTSLGTVTQIKNFKRSYEKVKTLEYHENLGIDKTPHNLRATFSTRLDHDFDVKKDIISFLMGHSVDIVVTDEYIDKEAEYIKEKFQEKAEGYIIGIQKVALEEISKLRELKIDNYRLN